MTAIPNTSDATNEGSITIDTHGLTDLGYMILMDRYTVKDPVRSNVKVDDLVVCLTSDSNKALSQKRELGIVKKLYSKNNRPMASVYIPANEETVNIPLDHIDRPLETSPIEVQRRVARGVAMAEKEQDRNKWQEEFEWLLSDWKFVPGGRILTAAGSGQQLSSFNCFVCPSPRDSRAGIMKSVAEMAEIMSRGGGVGLNISSLRPRHAYVRGVNGRSSGAVSWGGMYSYVTGLIEQAGSRRGALILIMNDWHPDVFDFINSKREAGKITNANISVSLSDKFMSILKQDGTWDLRFPDTSHPEYNVLWNGDLEDWESRGLPVIIHKTIKAKELWNSLVSSAWASAEPGMWFQERANKFSNSWAHRKLVSTNPCLTGDMVVHTKDGYFTIKELFDSQKPLVVVTDERFGKGWLNNSSHVFYTGNKAVYKLVTESGKFVRATGNHRIMTTNGWKELLNIRIGESVHTLDIINGDYTSTVSSVVTITQDGTEDVYDLNEPVTHSFIANGIVVHNCGEIGLSSYGICNLGAINLSKFSDIDKDGNPVVQWDLLRRTVKLGVRFLDDVIDTTFYFIDENEQVQKEERRVGLGIMGLAELLIQMKLRYGSKEANVFVDELFKFIAVNAYLTSSVIASEKGSYSLFDETVYKSEYMKGMPAEVIETIKKNGLRNVALLTCAPTGSIGSLVDTSTGLEPFFSWVYYRKSRLGYHEQRAKIADQYFVTNPDETKLPDYYVTAMELAPEEHVMTQAAIQRWVDQSISKTCNVPNEWTVDQVSDLYMLMYDSGCKGGTIYRDGSRDEQVLNLKKEEPVKADVKPVDDADTTDNVTSNFNVISPAAEARKPVLGVGMEKRPTTLPGKTFKADTTWGTLFVTINESPDGSPFEVFVTIGKSGSDLQAEAEAIGRLLSMTLRSVPADSRNNALEAAVGQLRGIGGSQPYGFGINRVASFPDAIAKVIEDQYINAKTEDGTPEELRSATQKTWGTRGLKSINAPSENIVPSIIAKTITATVGTYKNVVKPKHYGADTCPECKNLTLVREEGCQKCSHCGYSRC